MDKIIEESRKIDWTEKDLSGDISISFLVPKNHKRFSEIKNYQLKVGSLKNFNFSNGDLVLVDSGVKDYINESALKNVTIKYLKPSEGELKTLNSVNKLLSELRNENFKRVISIGGGIIINVSSYIAEQLKVDLVLFPTSLIAMCDASIGGHVLVNDIKDGKFAKHAYKTFYEPNEIILDPVFIEYIPEKWIRLGLAETIKHAIYQSELLMNYLLSDNFQPFSDKKSLLRAILWTADLKRVCLEIDPEQSKDGSYFIIRAGHDISDKMEEESNFTLNHGDAVEKAMLEDLASDPERLSLLKAIYLKIGI
ncbi:iron-containing alcohol dehydrogenase [Patescibacteria group bacterium]|nr:iron-containing alcohol dehydrogenase [Patescibacteria group bacterium]MBU1727800.1 iron-containing alcohol dehydrogenase [Patescibacteria group bacterium]